MKSPVRRALFLVEKTFTEPIIHVISFPVVASFFHMCAHPHPLLQERLYAAIRGRFHVRITA